MKPPGTVSHGHFNANRTTFFPRIVAGMVRLLHHSCRFTILGREHEDAALRGGGAVLYACWHFAFPVIIYQFRERNGMVMVSRSRDGERVARVLQHLGYRIVRGSQGKGGGIALRQMVSHLRSGESIGLVADGSQGPAQVAQKGIVILARHAQAPMVPVGVAAHPCWRFRSWDRTMLVKPFGRVAVAYGPPVWVDRHAPPEEIEEIRQRLEASLNQLTREAAEALEHKGSVAH